MKKNISRRDLLTGSALVFASQFAPKVFANESTTPVISKEATTDANTDPEAFKYEVNFTEEEWKAKLTPHEYNILRLGDTEDPHSSPLWKEKREGQYHCKGCGLGLYESKYKTVIKSKGWVFFKHSKADAVLTRIDTFTNYNNVRKEQEVIEVHCRRCGGHVGHVFYINNNILHCTNGASLLFTLNV
jgi:peptide-methionine (R)-S-oxide reductase